jgi:hypothetical protein
VPHKDPQRAREYFREYDARNAAKRKEYKRSYERREDVKARRRLRPKPSPEQVVLERERGLARRAAVRENRRRWEEAHPGVPYNPQMAWVERNFESKAAHALAHYYKRREEINARRRLRRTGMSSAERERLLREQGGLCSICRQPSDRPLRSDHCHATGKVRELLCSNCNLGLGNFRDRPEFLRAAIAYLERHR